LRSNNIKIESTLGKLDLTNVQRKAVTRIEIMNTFTFLRFLLYMT